MRNWTHHAIPVLRYLTSIPPLGAHYHHGHSLSFFFHLFLLIFTFGLHSPINYFFLLESLTIESLPHPSPPFSQHHIYMHPTFTYDSCHTHSHPIHHYSFIILPVFPSSLTPQPCSLHTTLIHFHLHSLILIRSVTYPLYIWQIIYYFIKFHFFFFFISSPTLSSHQSFCPLHICCFLHVHNIFF